MSTNILQFRHRHSTSAPRSECGIRAVSLVRIPPRQSAQATVRRTLIARWCKNPASGRLECCWTTFDRVIDDEPPLRAVA